MAEEIQEKMKDILYFILKMLIFSIPLYIILWTNWESVLYQDFITQQVREILHLMGMATHGGGNQFVLNGISFMISWDCTGWKSIFFLAALIFSTPSRIKRKINGLVIGIYGLFMINIFRIVILVNLAVTHGVELFNFAHAVLWQLFGGITVLLMWLIWLYLGNISLYSTD